MKVIVKKIVREYVAYVDGLDFTIKGRILEDVNKDPGDKYQWSISHHYRPSKNAGGLQIPSKISAPSVEEAEYDLLAYLHNFTTIDVTANEYY